jgi:Uma2 family endonuclease
MLAVAERRTKDLTPVANGLPPFVNIRRFTVAEYHRLGKLGLFGPEDRVELIDGYIIHKAMQNTPHARAVRRLVTRLSRFESRAWTIQSRLPITLPRNEPEPDGCVMIGPEERYDDRNPKPPDIVLVIEVADSSLALDRGAKLRAYARNRVPIYWIVNILEKHIEVYCQPRPGRTPGYQKREDFGRGLKVPVVLNGTTVGEIAVNELLP